MMSFNEKYDNEESAKDIPKRRGYRLPDMSVGDPNAENPLKKYTWPQLRAIMYGEEEYGEDEPE